MIEITQTAIEPAAVLALVQDERCGASLLFIGSTRGVTDGRPTESLGYECYEPMAREALQQLERQARQRWPIEQCAIVHRVGDVPVGQASVVIAVSSPHRAAAFEAGQWLIDTLKHTVPIWKQERYADGDRQWQHPDSPPQSASGSIRAVAND
jgi:molybdopterin synthase catalytic subunit